MLLTIRTLSCPPPDTPQSIHAQFNASGGRIGRSPPCTLILPDPNRHISREHAEIRYRDNAFSLKVVSKVNSVLVNDAVLSPGEAVELTDGDQILIGEYLLRADISAAAANERPAASFFDPPPPASSTNPFDVFDQLAPPPVPLATPELAPDWFRAPGPAPAAPPKPVSGTGVDDFFKPTAEDSRFNDVLQGSPPPTPPAGYPLPPSVATPVDNRLDQFLGLSGGLSVDPVAEPLRGSELYRPSALDLPLNAASKPMMPPAAPPPVAFPGHDDIFKALEQDFGALATPPLPAPPPAALAMPESAPVPAPIAPRPPPTVAVPVQPPVPAPVPPAVTLPAAPMAAAPVAAAWSGDEAPTLRLQADPVTAPLPGPAIPSLAAGVTSAEDAAEVQRLLQVLCEAMGLAPGDLDTSRPEQTMRLVGELLRLSTDGLFRMLEMRSQLKSELHIEDRTMIAARENNPLKHADTARDAIAYLVDLRQHGNKLFMPPTKAVEDTIWDICAHEMAVMAGTRAALLAALKMFSPEVIEGRIKKTGALENVLPALHKSRLWERFLGMYAELQHEAEDHFDRLLNQEFSKAYSEQAKKLKKKR
jgi:FHA domain-containing protein